MKARLIIFVSLFIFLGCNLFAQEEFEEQNWIEMSQANVSYVSQIGQVNSLVSIQEQVGLNGAQIVSRQEGLLNQGYIKQVGELHFTRMTQNGKGNEANIWSVGSKSISDIYQFGDNNTVNSYIDNQGWLPKAALLVQKGNNNSIELALVGNGFLWDSWPKAAIIKQNGNDLEITAKLDSYRSPIYIEQQSGFTGGGMSINISNSDFSFPTK